MKPTKPYLIGLTGGIASGKSTLSRALIKAGAPVIDADQISWQLTAPGGVALPLIADAFGQGVFKNGELDRLALGNLVFSDKAARERLNQLMHPMIRKHMQQQLATLSDQPAVVLDVPLLFETGWDKDCDEVWCVWVPAWVQIKRIIKRDGLTCRHAWQRVRSQMPGWQRRLRADHVIYTGGSKEQSAAKALALWNEALRRARHAH